MRAVSVGDDVLGGCVNQLLHHGPWSGRRIFAEEDSRSAWSRRGKTVTGNDEFRKWEGLIVGVGRSGCTVP